MTAASQSCHKDDKFFEVHLEITVFIQIPEGFIDSVLVLPRLQKKSSRLQWEATQSPEASQGARRGQGLWLALGTS